ncbi:MAG: hypothetical protein MI784_09605, partial [Cytophagales bacterium]|nr:hypothetical protein [Cytophagales bacterium]
MMNLLLTFSLVSFFHSFHVSVLDMRWNKEEKTIECSARLFVDDLENVLKEKHKRPFDLAVNYAQESGKIEQYVREMVHIKVSGREAALEFLGVEREEDALWVHFYVPKLKRLRRLWVKNEIFT